MCPTSRRRSTTRSGQSRGVRNAPVASAQTGCSPTRIGIVRFDCMPTRRMYAFSASASSGSSSGRRHPDGLTPDELRVVPGQLGLHDWGGVGLHLSARPRGGGREACPIGRELEQGAPVGIEELDEPTQAVLDLLVDALHGQPREADRELADEALGSAALVARVHGALVYQEESVTFHDLPRYVSAFRARRSTAPLRGLGSKTASR